jgi:3'(2'), 5'-bisphosphate nucleotidase
MVGLAERGRAVLGVIVAPAWGRSFVGIVGDAAWEVRADGTRAPVRVSRTSSMAEASVVVSRSHATQSLAALVDALGPRTCARHGSAGLKGALVAIGDHDAYLQTGRAGMRWDACATDALVRAAGGQCTDAAGRPFDYAVEDLVNRRGLVATNGVLHDAVIEKLEASHRA